MATEQSNLSEKIENHHSVFGIASLVSGILAFLLLLLNFSLFYFVDPQEGNSFLLDGLLLGNSLLIIIGIISGAIGLIQKNRKKTLAILGLILSFMTIILFCLAFAVLFIYAVIFGLSGV